MGFEQLAALRTQLAEKARQEKLAKQGGSGAKARGPRPPKQAVSESDATSDGTRHASEGKPKQAAGKPSNPAANKSAHKPAHHHGHKPVGGKPSTDRPPRGDSPAHGQHKKRTDRPARPAREPATPTDPVLLLIRKLQNRFTATFPKKPAPKVPLKIGVFEDLMVHAAELGADETQLRAAIKTWCGGSRYWACMVEGAARIDLAGNAAGVVTAADANRARRLEAHREKRAQQRVNAAGESATAPNGDATPAVTPLVEAVSTAEHAQPATDGLAATDATQGSSDVAGAIEGHEAAEAHGQLGPDTASNA